MSYRAPMDRASQLTTEIHRVMAVMRQNATWATVHPYSDDLDADDQLLSDFKALKKDLFSWSVWAKVKPLDYLAPFLMVIKSERTNAAITGVALTSVHKFLTADFFDKSTDGAAAAMASIVDAVTSCRFEVTDMASEEVVLMKILQLLLAALQCRAGVLLSDRDVCTVVNTCFRVVHQSASRGELLQRLACHTMQEMIRVIFGRLPDLPDTAIEELEGDERTEGTMIVPEDHEDGPARANSMDTDALEDGKTQQQEEDELVIIGADGKVEGEVTEGTEEPPQEEHERAAVIEVEASSEPAREVGGVEAVSTIPPSPSAVPPSPSAVPPSPSAVPPTSAAEAYAGSTPHGRPHGVACMVEIFHFLCSLLTLEDAAGIIQGGLSGDGDVSLFALELLCTAVELGGGSISRHPKLLSLVQDELMRSVMQLGLSPNLLVLSLACSLVLSLYKSLARHLKLQIEAFVSFVALRLAQGKLQGSSSPLHQEVALETLVDLCRQPQFVAEMYANYDADIGCANIFEDLASLLSKCAFPVNSPLTPVHTLALEGLLAVVKTLSDRAPAVPELSPADSTAKCSSEVAGAAVLPPPPDITSYFSFWDAQLQDAKDPAVWVPFVRQRKAIKRKLSVGADHFNRDPKKGLEFLQGAKLLPEVLDARAVACFFRFTPGLSKALLGEYLGDHDEFKVSVLLEFVGLFDFEGMPIDGALRAFLESFRLPGEAQKISRVLEAFADHYYAQCPGVLANKDAAFILAYSVIMLNTDQHNGQVRKKMTEEEFIRNNRKINDGQDLPREMLSELYHAIGRNEIRVSADSGNSGNTSTQSDMSYSLWLDLLRRSSTTVPYIGCPSRSHNSSACRSPLPSSEGASLAASSPPVAIDRDMFAVVAGPAIAAISVVLDHMDDAGQEEEADGTEEQQVPPPEAHMHLLTPCMEGFMSIAKIAAAFNLQDVLDDVVVSLCRFTTLLNQQAAAGGGGGGAGGSEDPAISFGEDAKARAATETLFAIAHHYGAYIKSSWRNVMDCVVQLHKMGLLPADVLLEVGKETAEGAGLVEPAPGAAVDRVAVDLAEGAAGGVAGLREEGQRDGSGLPLPDPAVSASPSAPGSAPGPEEDPLSHPSPHLPLPHPSLPHVTLSLISPAAAAAASATSLLGRKKSSGLMTRFTQMLLMEGGAAGDDEERMRQARADKALLSAHRRASQTVERCAVARLFSASSSLRPENSVQFVRAILWASAPGRAPSKPVAGGAGGPPLSPEEEDAAAFCLELLLVVVLANRHRLGLVWPMALEHLAGVVQSPGSTPSLVERAVFGQLRVCRHLLLLLHRQEQRQSRLQEEELLLRSLQLVLKLDAQLAEALCERITDHVLLLVRESGARITSPLGWRAVLSLLAITARHPDASAAGFQALELVLGQGGQQVSDANFGASLEAARDFAEARAGGVERSLSSLDLLEGLGGWLKRRAAREKEDGAPLAPPTLDLWLRLVHTIRRVCGDQREEVRNHALLCLQRCLVAAWVPPAGTLDAAAPVEGAALCPTPSAWGVAFDQVLFTLLDDLVDAAIREKPKDFRGMEGSLQLALRITSKVLLHALPQLQRLPPPSFRALWQGILVRLERYMKARVRGGGGEQLREDIPELLKNILLVMHARGALVEEETAGGGSLWEITWLHAHVITPTLTPAAVLPAPPPPAPAAAGAEGEAAPDVAAGVEVPLPLVATASEAESIPQAEVAAAST